MRINDYARLRNNDLELHMQLNDSSIEVLTGKDNLQEI
jgi:hypothetical protein